MLLVVVVPRANPGHIQGTLALPWATPGRKKPPQDARLAYWRYARCRRALTLLLAPPQANPGHILYVLMSSRST
eukprot:8100812-Alexandrium_andersonii.AAC.1